MQGGSDCPGVTPLEIENCPDPLPPIFLVNTAADGLTALDMRNTLRTKDLENAHCAQLCARCGKQGAYAFMSYRDMR
jgi:hypothetical protein